jgi:hypothetical protein
MKVDEAFDQMAERSTSTSPARCRLDGDTVGSRTCGLGERPWLGGMGWPPAAAGSGG